MGLEARRLARRRGRGRLAGGGDDLRFRPADGRRLRFLYVTGIALAATLAVLIAVGVWVEIDSDGYYRFLGAVAVAAVLTTLLQPIVRRIGGPGERGVRLVLALDRAPSEEAVEAVVEALTRHGIRVEEAVGPRV